ncbi:unnamed protein product, partial [Rotaria sp. Silwood1]
GGTVCFNKHSKRYFYQEPKHNDTQLAHDKSWLLYQWFYMIHQQHF